MTAPQTVTQVAFFLLLIVPGFVYAATRRRLRGGATADERDFSVRLIHGIAASVCLDCLYLLAIGWFLVDYIADPNGLGKRALLEHSYVVAIAVFLLALAIPAACGYGVQLVVNKGEDWDWVKKIREVSQFEVTPSAWDYAAPNLADCFVRVRLADGKWIGGYLPKGIGYVSTYPEVRDIFIPWQYHIYDDGSIGEIVDGTVGVYVPLTGNEHVLWTLPAGPDSPINDESGTTVGPVTS